MTFQTLYQNLATVLGLTTTATGRLTERKAWVNEAYRDVVAAFDWPTKYAYDVVQTVATEASSTLQAASAGDTALTANAAVWDTGWTNRKIQIGSEVYVVTTFGSTSTATIADGLTAAISDGQTYTVFQEEFDAPTDCAEILHVWPYSQSYPPLTKIDLHEWTILKARDMTFQATPSFWCPLGTASTGALHFGLHRPPNVKQNLHIHYVKTITEMTSDSDVPVLLPPQVHHLIGKRAKLFAFEMDREAGPWDRARLDYESALAIELNRLDPTSGRMRLDPEVFGGCGGDWVTRLRTTV